VYGFRGRGYRGIFADSPDLGADDFSRGSLLMDPDDMDNQRPRERADKLWSAELHGWFEGHLEGETCDRNCRRKLG
jgi:hypothetical protein